jgi:hypothetical protein
MAAVVRPCLRDGEKIFDDEGMDWRDRMRESSWVHQERIDMVTDARIDEMDTAARAGRAYVVACTPRLVTSAIQAKQLSKDVLMWLSLKSVAMRNYCRAEWLSRKNERTNMSWRCWNTGWSTEI